MHMPPLNPKIWTIFNGNLCISTFSSKCKFLPTNWYLEIEFLNLNIKSNDQLGKKIQIKKLKIEGKREASYHGIAAGYQTLMKHQRSQCRSPESRSTTVATELEAEDGFRSDTDPPPQLDLCDLRRQPAPDPSSSSASGPSSSSPPASSGSESPSSSYTPPPSQRAGSRSS